MPQLRAGLANRTGLTLLALSLALAAAVLVLPPLAPWSSRAALIAAIGVLAYLLTVAVYVIPSAPRPDTANSPAMAQLLDVRRQMADRLAELKSAPAPGQSALIPVVADALRHVDTELVPTLRNIVVRHGQLDKQLEAFRTGKVAAPDRESNDRLERIYARQEEAIDACVRQAANAYATLIALLQESDEARVVGEARLWATDLNDIYEGLADVLSGVDPYEQALLRARIEPGDDQPAEPRSDGAIHRVEPAMLVDGRARQPSGHIRAFPDGLTQREAEVLALLSEGLTSKEIADRLVVTTATVSRHIANIYTKIYARGRADATRYAIRHGITSSELFPPSGARGSSNGQAARPPSDSRR